MLTNFYQELLNMTFVLDFYVSGAENVVLPLSSEDYHKARDMGVLTPRSLVESDRVPTPFSGPKTSWAQKISGKSPSSAHIDAHQERIDEIDFLLLQSKVEDDAHEDMLDNVAALWEEDLDRTTDRGAYMVPLAPDGAPMFVPTQTSQVVRIILKKNGFYIGSIAGNAPNVYIKTDANLDIHSFYWMDLSLHIQGRNMWKCTKIHPKLDTEAMMDGSSILWEKCRCIRNSIPITQHYDYTIPLPAYNIGIIIGSQGRNITNLMDSISAGDSSDNPDVTITPLDDNTCSVKVDVPGTCDWTHWHVNRMVSHMHA